MVLKVRFSIFPDIWIFTPSYDPRHYLDKRQVDEKHNNVVEKVSVEALSITIG